jgi:hypothetical protein
MTDMRRGWPVSSAQSGRPGLPLALAHVLLTSGLGRAQTEGKNTGDDEARARALAGITLRFSTYVFAGKAFPRCECEQPERARELQGPYTIKTTFHDLNSAVVEQAIHGGHTLL